MLVFLPLAHVLARVATLAGVRAGMRIGFTSDLDDLPRELVGFRPRTRLGHPCEQLAMLRRGNFHNPSPAGAAHGSTRSAFPKRFARWRQVRAKTGN
jgi:hypothetical protein